MFVFFEIRLSTQVWVALLLMQFSILWFARPINSYMCVCVCVCVY